MQTGRDVVESHREAAADLLGRRGRAADLPGRQCRLAGTWRRAIEKMLPARDAVVEIHREAAAGRDAVAQRAARNPGQIITT